MPHNLHVVLIEPEIPSNTGSIGRACLATETTLHMERLICYPEDATLQKGAMQYMNEAAVIGAVRGMAAKWPCGETLRTPDELKQLKSGNK